MSEKEDDEQIGVNMYDDADKESSPLEESIEEDVVAALLARIFHNFDEHSYITQSKEKYFPPKPNSCSNLVQKTGYFRPN